MGAGSSSSLGCSSCGSGLAAALGLGGFKSGSGASSHLGTMGVDAERGGKMPDSLNEIKRDRVGSWTSPLPRAQFDADPVPAVELDFELREEVVDDPALHTSIVADPDAKAQRSVAAAVAHAPLNSAASPGDRRPHFLTEQLFASPGTLPKPLYADEGGISHLKHTATFDMLKKLPKGVVEAKGAEGQALRRRLLNEATIVFFTAGYPGKRFVFERARELGVKSVIIEHPDSWARSLVDEGIIAKFIPIDMSQETSAVFEQSLAAIRALADDPTTREADGICTFCELSVPVVARLSEHLQLPGHSPVAVDKARDKHWTRAEMRKAGLPSPKNMLIHSTAELESAAKEVGFPAVLKPISGAASLGVKKVVDMEDLKSAYQEVIEELRSLVVSSGALVKNDGTGTGVNANQVMDCTILMEQYLDGDEVDIDVVMSGGEWRYAAVTDNGPTLEPYFNETWAVCPSLLPSSKQKLLKDLATDTVKCLGFKDGVFHVEAKLTSHGPQLIEVNARMGGGPVHETNLRVWGIDLVEETLFACVGIPSRPFIPSRNPPGGAIAYCDVNAKKSGILQSMDFLKILKGKDGVVSAKPHLGAGAEVVGPQDGLPTWLVEIIVQRPTAQAALDYLLELENSLDPPIV
mmetsp:Transcript_75504/g.164725  ORF Transcript_75504/g.164725 Transcript_75504/m.164725 type:complete len:635 (+) Transcript_75504:193-2097(+)